MASPLKSRHSFIMHDDGIYGIEIKNELNKVTFKKYWVRPILQGRVRGSSRRRV